MDPRLDPSDELAEIVCRSVLEAVRGHGGESARWLAEATSTAHAVLDELVLERPDEAIWRWLAGRLARW